MGSFVRWPPTAPRVPEARNSWERYRVRAGLEKIFAEGCSVMDPKLGTDGLGTYDPRNSFKPGDRVELSPHMDLWMQGARYGTVRRVQDTGTAIHYLIRMDHKQVRRLIRLTAGDMRRVA